jgi:hypothetical protein
VTANWGGGSYRTGGNQEFITSEFVKEAHLHIHIIHTSKVKLSVCVINHHPMKVYRGGEVQLRAILFSEINEGEWSVSRSGRFTRGKRPLIPIRLKAGWARNCSGTIE